MHGTSLMRWLLYTASAHTPFLESMCFRILGCTGCTVILPETRTGGSGESMHALQRDDYKTGGNGREEGTHFRGCGPPLTCRHQMAATARLNFAFLAPQGE
eukprot:1158984-Pelagomonas_calceolata.AAC.6